MFCSTPFTKMTMGPDGGYRSCCYWPTLEGKYNNVMEAFHSDEMDSLRKMVTNNQHYDMCSTCFHHEDQGITSLREYTNEKHPYTDTVELNGLELALDNKCNYACITCKPESSTVWEQRLGPIQKSKPSYEGVKWNKLKHLSITGGEPTIQKEFSPDFFKMLSNTLNDECSFSMNTNSSKFVHKEWKEFVSNRDSTIMLSLDGIGEVGEWVRYGLKMDVWERIALRWKSISKVHCNFVLTNYNIFNLQDTVNFLDDLGIEIRKTNCFVPECLSPEYLPDEIKEDLPKDSFIQSILNNNKYDRDHCKQFLKYTDYLQTFSRAPQDALYIYNRLKDYENMAVW